MRPLLAISPRSIPTTLLHFVVACLYALMGQQAFAQNAALPSAQSETKILILGDSLTEGFGVNPEQAYPALVQHSLRAKGYAVQVINGGESGSTTAGGLSRLDWYLRLRPTIVLIALGGNDGLRGQSVPLMSNNLRTLIDKAKNAGAQVALAGMQIPPNYGAEYTQSFKKSFPDIAKEKRVVLLPFLLAGVGGVTAYMQKDGIHPNVRGQQIIAKLVEEFILKEFSPLLAR